MLCCKFAPALSLIALLGSAGCASPPTSLLIEVTNGNPELSFDMLEVQVFDSHRRIASGTFSASSLPGSIQVAHLQPRASTLRVVVRAEGASSSLGGVRVTTQAGMQTVITIDLGTSLPDGDGDGVPDVLDDCPDVADPDQRSAYGGAPGDACGGPGADGAADLATPADGGADLAMPDGSAEPPADLAPPDLAPPVDLAGVLLLDDFNGATLDSKLWTSSTGNGGSVVLAGGKVTLTAPGAASSYAEIAATQAFPVGTIVEAQVTVGAPQTYDEKGIGFADKRLSDDCQGGETESAMLRGLNGQFVNETKANNLSQCDGVDGLDDYPEGAHLFKIVRVSPNQVDFYVDGNKDSATARIPQGQLPIRFGVFTSTVNPSQKPVVLVIDWVRVTKQ